MSLTEAITLLEDLHIAGITISLRQQQLALDYFGEPPSPALLQRVRTQKETLTELLRGKMLPLSSQQQRLWFLCQTDPHSRAYYVTHHFALDGPLNIPMVVQAFRMVIDRHDILRTVFLVRDGIPYQWVIPQEEMTIEIDQASVTAEFLEELGHWSSGIRLHLEKGPLLKIRLSETPEKSHIVSIVIHHIICDALSLQVLFNEALQNYHSLVTGAPFSRDPLSRQYGNYVLAERIARHSPEFAKDRSYWLEVFPTVPEPLVLPYKVDRPARKTFNGNFLSVVFPEVIVGPFRQLSKTRQCSFFSSLLALLTVLFKRYSSQRDIIIGTSVANPKLALQDQIGLYAQTLPLCLRLQPETSFHQLLDQSASVLLGALSHQAYPFETLVQERYQIRDLSRSPFFDCMIDYFAISGDPGNPSIGVRSLRTPSFTSKFDLTFTFSDNEEHLSLSVEYNTDLFDEPFVSAMCTHLANGMKAAVADPQMAIDRLPLFDDKRPITRPLVTAANKTPLRNRLIESAAKYSRQPAICYHQQTYTYQWLDTRSDNLARQLLDMIQPDRNAAAPPADEPSVIAIFLDNSPDSLVCLWAIIKTGHSFLPIDTGLPKDRLAHILQDSGTAILLTTADHIFRLPQGYKGRIMAVDIQLDNSTEPARLPATTILPDQTAYLMYTSGSTGQPKGVAITNNNLLNYLDWASVYYYEGISSGLVPWFTSISFDLTITSLFLPLLTGGAIDILPANQQMESMSEIANAAVSGKKYGLAKLTPSHLDLLAMLEPGSFPVDAVICGGEELLQRHITLLQKLNPAIIIYNEYGPTETTVGCTVERVTANRLPHSIGIPVPFASVYITDEYLQPVPEDVWGEIVVAGSGVGKGYLNRQNEQAKRFISLALASGARAYRTGDKGRKRRNGVFECAGRLDDQIKFNGQRIEPGEIEKLISLVPGITQCAVFLRCGKQEQKDLVAVYSSRTAVDPNAIRSFLLAQLPSAWIPNLIIPLQQLPLTMNGKLDKPRTLAAIDAVNLPPHDIDSTLSPLQQRLAAYFRTLLDTDHIGVSENLFTRGLDSLKAVKAQSDLNQLFPGSFEINDLFSHPTVSELSTLIGEPDASLQKETGPELVEF